MPSTRRSTPSASETFTRPLSHLELVAWSDSTPAAGRPGHDPRSAYVERFWLGVLGPSAIWFLRLARRELDAASGPTPAVLDLEDTARQLGVGHRGGRHSALIRCIDRCADFGVARAVGPASLAVRTELPGVPTALRARLPATLRSELSQWHEPEPGRLDLADAAAVARALCRLGVGLHESAERLASWGVGLDDARQATATAWSQHSSHPSAGGPIAGPDLRVVTSRR